LAEIALLLALSQAPAMAIVISVKAGCTLVQALNSANDNVVVGSCTRGNGADTIRRPTKSVQILSWSTTMRLMSQPAASHTQSYAYCR
jgi:hypothetical protein